MPTRKKAAELDDVTPDNRSIKQRQFLAAIRETGNISAAARAANVHRSCHYGWIEDDPEYIAEFRHAMDEAGDKLVEEARRRAVTGVLEPVYGRISKDKDGKIGTLRRYSDALLTLLIKGAKPEEFRDRSDVKHGGGIDHHHRGKIDLGALSITDLEALDGIAAKLDSAEPASGAGADPS